MITQDANTYTVLCNKNLFLFHHANLNIKYISTLPIKLKESKNKKTVHEKVRLHFHYEHNEVFCLLIKFNFFKR